MPHQASTWFGTVFVLGVCIAAASLGGRPERVTAGAILAQLVWSDVTHAVGLNAVQYGALIGDALLLGVVGGLMFVTQRRWTIWATGFQALAVCSHVVRLIDPTLRGWAYMTSAIFFGYAVLGALAVGVLEARRTADTAATAPSIG